MSTQSTLSQSDATAAFVELLDSQRGPLGATALSVLEPILLSEDPVSVAELRQKLPLSRTHLATTLLRLAQRQLILHVERGVYVRNPDALQQDAPAVKYHSTTSCDRVALRILEELLLTRQPATRERLHIMTQSGPGVLTQALNYLLDRKLIEEVQRSVFMLSYTPPLREFLLESEMHK